MTLSTQQRSEPTVISGELLEKIQIKNDLSGLSSFEKVQYLRHICHSLGINPDTNPIKIISFQGKDVPYFSKEFTEQLRSLRKISITDIKTEILEGGIYVVTTKASNPEGRIDSSTGAISISGLKGDNLCNAMLKAETKAKRRVTLSICGLGYIDESEADSIPGAKKVNIRNDVKLVEVKEEEDDISDYSSFLHAVQTSQTLVELKSLFEEAIARFRKNKKLVDELIAAKDKRKLELDQVEEAI